jgi:c-di-GMP-binding flagellar brake protein YcgR
MMATHYVVFAAACISGAVLFSRLLLRRRLHSNSGACRDFSAVHSQAAITRILEQSIAERRSYELVLDLEGRPLTLEGIPMDCDEHTLSLNIPSDKERLLDVEGVSLMVYFRIGNEDNQQFFYFHSPALRLERVQSGTIRHLYLRLQRPRCLYRGQRRRHFRLKPGGCARITVSLAVESDEGDARESTRFVAAPVEDISAGGLKVIVENRVDLEPLGAGTTVLLTVALQPCFFAAEGAQVQPVIRFRSEVLENSVLESGRRVFRFRFLAREITETARGRPRFSEDLDSLNEDLSRWIHACHRSLLRQWRLPTRPVRRPEPHERY